MKGWWAQVRPGDQRQARRRVNYLVEKGRIPHPNTLPCTDCGHEYAPGERRHEYDHHQGYDTIEQQLAVQPVCTTCHHQRDNFRLKRETCVNGHPWTAETTRIVRGCRECIVCRRAQDRGRRDAAWWRERRRRKKAEHG